MAEKHPYTSGPAGIVQTVMQFRRSLPAQVTSDTLKKLSIAPNNETYILNIMRFIGVLDSTNKRTSDAVAVFNQHDDREFEEGFAKLVSTAYHDLFDLHGEGAWNLPPNKLISYFRSTDHTSDLVGRRQASTFSTLAGIGGKVTVAERPVASKPKRSEPAKTASNGNGIKLAKPVTSSEASKSDGSPVAVQNGALSLPAKGRGHSESHGMALTVRIEINLPAGGDQDTYDRIFKSIRANLLNNDVT